MSAATVQPALDVLDDPRLANARTHLVEAQQRLQEHDPDEAVDEARMAVEYGMLALLDATGTPRPAKHQPQDLFNALAARGHQESNQDPETQGFHERAENSDGEETRQGRLVGHAR